MMNNDDSSAYSDDDFMSPFAPLRATFPTPKCESETLTASKDSSFIGARVSPVAFDNGDEDDEDRAIIEPYHKALHDSLNNSSFSNERTSLLGRRSVRRRGNDAESANRGADNDSKAPSVEPPRRRSWGMVLCVLSGIHLACMAIHDLYVWYLSFRLGRYSRQQVAWTLPLISPSKSTLLRFGALNPWKVLHGQAWQMITSLCMSTSLVEYILMCGSWYTMRNEASASFGLYIMATVTGQLWTIAWADPSSVSGGALLGTCGVLCATGVAKPQQKWVLLVVPTCLFLTSMTAKEGINSFMGILGSSTFGFAYYGSTGHSLAKEKVESTARTVRMLSAVVLVVLWLTPLLWIAFADTEQDKNTHS